MGPKAVLVKGGHATGAQSVDMRTLRGTGCILSSAIAAGLAKGLGLHDAIRVAKAHVTEALAAA
jgi:hydroxymethylpyrimidine/phosphomethylpyrimidine kinase